MPYDRHVLLRDATEQVPPTELARVAAALHEQAHVIHGEVGGPRVRVTADPARAGEDPMVLDVADGPRWTVTASRALIGHLAGLGAPVGATDSTHRGAGVSLASWDTGDTPPPPPAPRRRRRSGRSAEQVQD